MDNDPDRDIEALQLRRHGVDTSWAYIAKTLGVTALEAKRMFRRAAVRQGTWEERRYATDAEWKRPLSDTLRNMAIAVPEPPSTLGAWFFPSERKRTREAIAKRNVQLIAFHRKLLRKPDGQLTKESRVAWLSWLRLEDITEKRARQIIRAKGKPNVSPFNPKAAQKYIEYLERHGYVVKSPRELHEGPVPVQLAREHGTKDWSRYEEAKKLRLAGKTLKEVGEALNVTAERARQMIKRWDRVAAKSPAP